MSDRKGRKRLAKSSLNKLLIRWREYPSALRFSLALDGVKLNEAARKMLDALCDEELKKPEIPY
jgi:hypothetical protein